MITYADEQDYDRDDHGALWIRKKMHLSASGSTSTTSLAECDLANTMSDRDF
jgi:hypothetical protein